MDVVPFDPPAPKPAGPPPAPAAAPRIRLPFQPGPPRPVTAEERAWLEPIGWTDGKPVPGDLAKHLADARARDAEAHEAARAAMGGLKPLDFDESRATDIKALSPESVAELQGKFAEMVQSVAMLEAAGPTQAMPPGVGAAIAQAQQPAAISLPPGMKLPTSHVIPQSPPAAAPPPPPPSAAPATDPAPADATGVATPHPRYCPYCAWDLGQTALPEPTDEEKRAYLTACCTGDPYAREVTLMGGSLRVRFREVTQAEIAAIWAQVDHETEPGSSFEAMQVQAYFYRMLAATQAIVRGGVAFEIPTIAAIAARPDRPEWPLEWLRGWIKGRVLPTETLWNVFEAEYRKFRALLGRLEANAANPDFFAGIPGPA